MTLQIAPNNSSQHSHSLTHNQCSCSCTVMRWNCIGRICPQWVTPLSNCLYRFHIPLAYNGREKNVVFISSLAIHKNAEKRKMGNLSRWHSVRLQYRYSSLIFIFCDQLYTQCSESSWVSVKIRTHTDRRTQFQSNGENTWIALMRLHRNVLFWRGCMCLCAIEIKKEERTKVSIGWQTKWNDIWNGLCVSNLWVFSSNRLQKINYRQYAEMKTAHYDELDRYHANRVLSNSKRTSPLNMYHFESMINTMNAPLAKANSFKRLANKLDPTTKWNDAMEKEMRSEINDTSHHTNHSNQTYHVFNRLLRCTIAFIYVFGQSSIAWPYIFRLAIRFVFFPFTLLRISSAVSSIRLFVTICVLFLFVFSSFFVCVIHSIAFVVVTTLCGFDGYFSLLPFLLYIFSVSFYMCIYILFWLSVYLSLWMFSARLSDRLHFCLSMYFNCFYSYSSRRASLYHAVHAINVVVILMCVVHDCLFIF